MKTIIIVCLLELCSVVDPGPVSLKECNQLIIEGKIPECKISRDLNTSCKCDQELDFQSLRIEASPS